jgi:hypothetical protein
MSDTPRTDAAYTLSTGAGIYELFKESQDIERELNAASKERDDALMMLGMYRMKSDEQKHRIKRLEEAGDKLSDCANQIGWTSCESPQWIKKAENAVKEWRKAKEAKP